MRVSKDDRIVIFGWTVSLSVSVNTQPAVFESQQQMTVFVSHSNMIHSSGFTAEELLDSPVFLPF